MILQLFHFSYFLAIKKCKWNLLSHLTVRQRERWSNEVEMMKTFTNSNIVGYRKMPVELNRVLEKSNSTKLPILSMEYCALGNLRDVLTLPENSSGLPELQIKYILLDMANALLYLHKLNITHRDVKPENIVLQRTVGRQTNILYKIIDLGYAKELDSQYVSFVGTLQYIAPEIFNTQSYDCSVDYWSLGIVAFEIICGMRPFLHSVSPADTISPVEW